jgi:hypothetical protein
VVGGRRRTRNKAAAAVQCVTGGREELILDAGSCDNAINVCCIYLLIALSLLLYRIRSYSLRIS